MLTPSLCIFERYAFRLIHQWKYQACEPRSRNKIRIYFLSQLANLDRYWIFHGAYLYS